MKPFLSVAEVIQCPQKDQLGVSKQHSSCTEYYPSLHDTLFGTSYGPYCIVAGPRCWTTDEVLGRHQAQAKHLHLKTEHLCLLNPNIQAYITVFITRSSKNGGKYSHDF